MEEKTEHKFFRVKGSALCIRCFANNESAKDILLRIGNTTAIAYINKMDSIQFPRLFSMAKMIGNSARLEIYISLHLMFAQERIILRIVNPELFQQKQNGN